MNILKLIQSFFTGKKVQGTIREVSTFCDKHAFEEKSSCKKCDIERYNEMMTGQLKLGVETVMGVTARPEAFIPPKKCYHNRNGYKPMTEEVVAIIAFDRQNYKIKPCKRCGTVRYKKIQKSPGEVSVPGLYHCKAIALEDIRPNSYCILLQSPADGRHFIRMANANDGSHKRAIFVYSEFGAKKGRVMVNIPSDKGDACFEVKL